MLAAVKPHTRAHNSSLQFFIISFVRQNGKQQQQKQQTGMGHKEALMNGNGLSVISVMSSIDLVCYYMDSTNAHTLIGK